MLSVNISYGMLPDNNAIPGGIAVVHLDAYDNKPQASFGPQPLLVMAEGDQWYALVGLSQDTPPGKYLLTLILPDGSREKKIFHVSPLPSKLKQRITILAENFTALELPTLHKTDMLIITDEHTNSELLQEIDFTFQQIINNGNYLPYGRVVKNTAIPALSSHPWITYFVPPGETVFAPARGIVDKIFQSKTMGTSVVILHADGLKSIISNLDEISIPPGDIIESGDVIGTTSANDTLGFDRADWFLLLNGEFIDPALLIP